MPKRLIAVGLLALACVLAVPAGLTRPRMVSGDDAQARVNNLTSEIRWYQSLDQAKAVAREQGKMVFWVHMLGNLSGAT